jgi:hypothetical protein
MQIRAIEIIGPRQIGVVEDTLPDPGEGKSDGL